ncbi:MAG: signal peptidase I [Chitinispirillia bacterium]|nr:signal peptidase I [Chitinispirillia bacterium]MCL2241532.1 signal peptidase I [Chitinispirillia bacterium]
MNRRKLLWEKFRGRADMRPILKTGVVSFFIVLLAGLTIKLFVLDSLKVNGEQMEPEVLASDRILLFKTPYITPLVRNLFASHNKTVVAELPSHSTYTILRIAAVAGDIISVDEGQFYRNGQPLQKFHKNTELHSIVPAEYSPVDFMAPFKLPERGDSITFAGLDMRDLIFAYSILRQEKNNIRMKPFIISGGNTDDNYEINDFALYNGPISEIPEHMRNNWFFWDRLREYIEITTAAEEKNVQLAFSFFKGDKEISGFKVKKKYVFLLGDNWIRATDSRYFGPVSVNHIQGHAFMALWWFGINDAGKLRFNTGRILKLIK